MITLHKFDRNCSDAAQLKHQVAASISERPSLTNILPSLALTLSIVSTRSCKAWCSAIIEYMPFDLSQGWLASLHHFKAVPSPVSMS